LESIEQEVETVSRQERNKPENKQNIEGLGGELAKFKVQRDKCNGRRTAHSITFPRRKSFFWFFSLFFGCFLAILLFGYNTGKKF
jgi:hypothetical protein